MSTSADICECGHEEHEHERHDFRSRDDCTVCTCAHFIDAEFRPSWLRRLTNKDFTATIYSDGANR